MARILLAAFVALLLVVGPCHARPEPQHAAKSAVKGKTTVVDGITAIYNFGDSLSDTGNLLREGAGGMLQYTTAPPYGSAIGGTTGRCSDGSLAVQLQQFKDFMNANTRSPQEIREKLARSLVMVGEIGGNDYNYAFSANRPAGDGERNIYNYGRMAAGRSSPTWCGP
ncbi:acetylajmalan esterase-like [Panicum miliaceum]|uniref:Acetylajmalan esterase-like n=1 Tax=Panicum miliaceum TaxID=4540 RepID=A0A3L6QGC9_PANMI|nr:acetylajmalan esterase-like [Panicum miliaceum]